MEALTSKQKKYLKAQAHPLKALVQIGKSGVTDESIRSIHTAISQHELLKVKFIAFKEEKDSFVEAILEGANAQFVSMIGHILTLYRQHDEQEKRKYKLPK